MSNHRSTRHCEGLRVLHKWDIVHTAVTADVMLRNVPCPRSPANWPTVIGGGAVRRRWRTAARVVVVASTFAAASCSGPDSSQPADRISPPATTSAQTPTDTSSPASVAEAQAAEAALAVYRSYWNAVVEASKIPDPRYPDLEKFAADRALANEYSTLLLLERQGIVYTGEPTLDPKVASVELATSPLVTITDCIDSTNWQPVYKASGSSAAAPGQLARVPGTAEARPYGNGWVITNSTADRSRTC